MSSTSVDTAEVIIRKMEKKLDEREQREILARLKHSGERLNSEIVGGLTYLIKHNAKRSRSAYYHMVFYHRILDMEQEQIKQLIDYFVAKYPDPNWEGAKLIEQREKSEGIEISECATLGCQGVNYGRGLCEKCYSRHRETDLLILSNQEINDLIY